MKQQWSIILSCEHAGNKIPLRYKKLFNANQSVLKTHRGYDIGIAAVAKRMRERLDCPLCLYPWTRLLVEPNRTRPGSLFSEFSKNLNPSDQQHVLETYYLPYRTRLQELIKQQCRNGKILHISLHSFTPILNGICRNADIGILYDPSRKQELQFAVKLQDDLQGRSDLRIRRNYPYSGRSDGMTTWLRKQYQPTKYLGIEIEVNQAILTPSKVKYIVALSTLLADGIQRINLNFKD